MYENNNIDNVVLSNTKIECIKDDGSSCDLVFKLTSKKAKLQLENNSSIHGRYIDIDSPGARLVIDNTSNINADGASRNMEGQDKNNDQGASFVGYGGYCGLNFERDVIYGRFDHIPVKSALTNEYGEKYFIGTNGSNEKAFMKESGGGGRIYIDVDSIELVEGAKG